MMRRDRFCFWILMGCLAFVWPSNVWADVTGSILGTVTDSSSAIIQGVRVTATNLDLNLVKETSTNESGQYRLLALPVGRYKVEASFAGFRNFVQTGIVLSVNDQRRVDVVLQVGEAQQEVSVSAEALQVESTNTQLGEVIEEKKILELPLNGRGYIGLLGLQPGVAPGGTRNEGAGTVSVNGQRENSNGFLVNGGDVSGVGNFEAQIQPNLDAVQEFRLITNNFDAEYGRFSGALMNTVTKSGSNSIHGTVFEFLRNDALDARSFFDSDKPGKLRKNQFGYAVGGPAIKDKLFWYTDYQGTRQRDAGSAEEITVLSAAERGGNVGVANLTGNVNGPNWANVLSQRLGYVVHDGEPYSQVFPNGIIPQSAFSSAAKGTLQFIPQPNRGENIFASNADPIRTTDDMFGNRVDFLNKKTGNWSVYYYFDRSDYLDPKMGGSFPGFAGSNNGTKQQATVSNTRIFGPTAVNEFRVNYTRIPVNIVPESGAPSLESMGFITGNDTLGINNSGPTGYTGVPTINLNQTGFGFGTVSPSIQAQNTYQVGDSFSKIHGRHSLKFGGEYRYYQMNQRNAGGPVGSFDFNGAETGYDVADYLLGAPVDYAQSSLQLLDSRSKYGAAYAQDSFRVKPNLTLNFGLRWEFSTPWYDTQDKIVTMIPGQQSTQYPTAPTGLLYPGDAGIPRTLAPTRYNNFAPRLGIAWSPTNSDGFLGKLFGGPGKTSIRIGSGMFYTAIQDQTLYWILGTAPFGEYWGSAAPPLFEEPFRSRADGSSQGQKFPFVIPAPGSPEAKNFDFTAYEPFASTLGYWHQNDLPYGIHYNFTIQRQLTSS
ncbi:MAG TPA: carboxypeptidase regulatory-like domain-containing protein, partial [Terriglobia bacterium]|nr:carboxypeptidase regulatory-like domain-containing protein [Terriglobia bacterium]